MIDAIASYGSLFDLILFNTLLALSQYIVLRAGVFSLGTAAFAALGGYAAALVATRTGLPTGLGIAAGLTIGAAAGGIVAIPLARLRGVFQAIATLALVQLVLSGTINAVDITNGALGINGIPKTVGTLGLLVAVAAVLYVMTAISGSSIGRAFDVIRQDETVAVALGISVPRHHMIAFILSGAIGGLAGGLHAYSSYSITPNEYGFHMLVTVLAMVVLGGRRSVLGPFVGAVILTALPELVRDFANTQAIDLICRFLLRPGDAVLVDDPCYFNFQALLRAHQVRIVGVPYTPAGPDVTAFEAALVAERPRLYITNSALHNPTGATLSPQTAYRLLSAASAHDMTIVEDDIFADFEPEPSPRLAVLDGFNRVIRIGSFSKTLSASIRCGYIAARADWIEGLIDLQVATSFGGPSPVATELIASVLAGGGYRKHMVELRQRLARARHETATRLEPLGIRPWLLPRGGFYLWCRLPEDQDSASLARRAVEENVVLAPGNVFSVSQTATAFLRFNVAQSADPRVLAVLKRAMGSNRAE